jgi:vacuole morphology and inheritance protein 14
LNKEKVIYSSRVFEAVVHNWFIAKDRGMDINWKKPLVQESSIKTLVKIAQHPFSEGAMRYAFYMKDVELGEELVAKLPKKISAKSYNILEMKKDIESMLICGHIVSEFNERIVSFSNSVTTFVEFVHSYIYELTDPSAPFPLYYGENFIQGKYKKYNNNAGWKAEKESKKTLSAQALSHFSWQLTKGYLIIVDLQGVGNVLTDPQIHCINKKKFGKGNLGIEGILLFFDSHVCNEYCEYLGLINPKACSKLPPNFELFKEAPEPSHPGSRLLKLCDICKHPFEVSYGFYKS